jgi:hypothetical protein
MDSKEFRSMLVDMVKASGQEVINRAEELVGEGDLISDFDIWLRFPINGRQFEGCPTIEVTKSHVSKESFKVFDSYYGKEKNNE